MDRGQSPQHDAAHGYYKEMLIYDGHFDCCVIVSEDRGNLHHRTSLSVSICAATRQDCHPALAPVGTAARELKSCE